MPAFSTNPSSRPKRAPVSATQAVSLLLGAPAPLPGFDQVAKLAPKLAAELFDTGVNMGPGVAIQFLQRALNALNRGARDYADLKLDGTIGAVTLGALSAFLKLRGTAGERVLVTACEALQGERYLHLAEQRPANEAFLYGWLANRIG